MINRLTLVFSGGCDSAATYSWEYPTYSDYSINSVTSRTYESNTTWPGSGDFGLVDYFYGGVQSGVGIMYQNAFGMTDGTSADNTGQYSMSVCKSPSQTWLAFDANDLMCSSSCSSATWKTVVFRHPNTSANFCYFDGHVENLKTTQIDGLTNYVWPGTNFFYAPYDKRAALQQNQ